MTDEQIIKALECCNADDVGSCNDCPLVLNNEGLESCVNIVGREVIGLINRQKAEIERLNTEKKALLLTVENMRKEIRRLQVILVNFMDEVYEWGNKNNVDTNNFAQIAILGAERDKVVKEIKSEAIKEFAERLKDFRQWDVDFPEFVYVGTIDNLVKEMTEKE